METNIFTACSNGDLESVKQIIEKDKLLVNCHADAFNEVTPLIFATMEGHEDIVRFLVSKGADVNGENSCGLIALHYACMRGQKPIVALFIKKKANINKIGLGTTPLMLAVQRTQTEIVDTLLENGADPLVRIFPLGGSRTKDVFDVMDDKSISMMPKIFEKRFDFLKKKLKKKVWTKVRLLWIGQNKEGDECPFSRLPREMIKLICSFDLSSEEEKKEVGWLELERVKQKFFLF